jgi:pimeloyl-ACP methyl ester carboxylesterase
MNEKPVLLLMYEIDQVHSHDQFAMLLLVSYLMFVLPDIRGMIRDGKLEGSAEQLKRVVDLPCTGHDVAEVYNLNYQKIKDEAAADRADMYMQSIEEKGPELNRQEIVKFDDAKSEEECVYAIAVNHAIKRVTVAFRGSVSTQDFVQDAKAVLVVIPNPVEELLSKTPRVAIHLGFREYLYGRRSGSKTTTSEPIDVTIAEATVEKQKYQVILAEVGAIFKDHPDYRLYVAGHSLGGALATIFSFEAAAKADIPKPVTCITSGAPKVGNLNFLVAFENLEEKGHLRCLRVANYRDLVPLSPPSPPITTLVFQGRRFRHVGMRLKLTPQTFFVSFPPKVRSYCGVFFFDLIRMLRTWAFALVGSVICFLCTCETKKRLRREHTQLVYMERFENQKHALEQLTLDGLYQERFAQARWRLPVLHFDARTTTAPPDSDQVQTQIDVVEGAPIE